VSGAEQGYAFVLCKSAFLLTVSIVPGEGL